jgi:hypothetical protein
MSRFLTKISPLVKTRGFSTSLPSQSKNNLRVFFYEKYQLLTSCIIGKKAFLVVVHDYQDPECLQRRKDVRDQHLAVAKDLVSSEQMLLGGPIMDNHEVKSVKLERLCIFN